MKQYKLILFCLLVGVGFQPMKAQQKQLHYEDFQQSSPCPDGTDYFTFGGFNGSGNSAFGIGTGASPSISSGCVTYLNASDPILFNDIDPPNTSHRFLKGYNIDDAANPNTGGDHGSAPESSGVFFDDINTANYTNLKINLRMGSQRHVQYFNSSSYMKVMARMDNGNWKEVAILRMTGAQADHLAVDTDGDGIGDGIVADSYKNFTFDIQDTGSLLDIRLEAFIPIISAIIFDDVEVRGDPMVASWNGSSWSPDAPSVYTDTVYVRSSTAVPNSFSCKHLVIDPGFTFSIASGQTATVDGDIVNNGNGLGTNTGATIALVNNELTNSQLKGNAISTQANFSVASGVTLTSNNLLTLAATSTTSYGQIKIEGSFVGNLTYQGFIDVSSANWHHLGSPVATNLGDFGKSGFWLQASTNSGGSVWRWNADVSNWVAPGALTDAASPGVGYSFYAGVNGSGNFLTDGSIELSGAPNVGNQTVTFLYDNGQSSPISFVGGSTVDDTEGWNLASNPYPCVYDWDGGNHTLITTNAIYSYRNNGSFATYVNNVGTNGGTRYIAPLQGFFVQISDEGALQNPGVSGDFTFAAANTTLGQNPGLFKTQSPAVDGVYLKLLNPSNGFSDELFAGFGPGASFGFDSDYDARKLVNEDGQNIWVALGSDNYSICRTDAAYALNGHFPVFLEGVDGTSYDIVADISNLKSYKEVELLDLYTDKIYDLTSDITISVVHDAGFNGPRFLLRFGKAISALGTGPEDSMPNMISYIYSDETGIHVVLNETEAEVEVFDVLGRPLGKAESADNGRYHFEMQQKGLFYVLKVTGSSNTGTRKIVH